MTLLTVEEISKLLNASSKTVYQWAKLGQIPSIKLNGCVRFDFDDIKEWICSCKKAADNGYNPLTQARGPRKGGK